MQAGQYLKPKDSLLNFRLWLTRRCICAGHLALGSLRLVFQSSVVSHGNPISTHRAHCESSNRCYLIHKKRWAGITNLNIPRRGASTSSIPTCSSFSPSREYSPAGQQPLASDSAALAADQAMPRQFHRHSDRDAPQRSRNTTA